MKSPKRRRRLGIFFFAVPVVVIGVLAAFAALTTFGVQNGTIVVRATGNVGSGPVVLSVAATLNGRTIETPYSATLPAGSYTVVFSAVNWYVTPPPHAFTLEGGKTAYAVGIYNPTKEVIGISQAGFNQSAVGALHGVTPVVWANTGSQYVVVVISGTGNVGIAPGQTYSKVFSVPGTYEFSLLNTNLSGQVTVI